MPQKKTDAFDDAPEIGNIFSAEQAKNAEALSSSNTPVPAPYTPQQGFGDTGVIPGIIRGVKSFDPRNIAPPNPPMSPTNEQIAGVGTAIQHVSEHPLAFAAGQIPVVGPMLQNFIERFKTDPHGAASELATQLAIPGAAYGITGAMDAVPGAVKSAGSGMSAGLPSVLKNMAESGVVRGGLRSVLDLSRQPEAPTPPPSEIAPPIMKKSASAPTPPPQASSINPSSPTVGEQPNVTTTSAGSVAPKIQLSRGTAHIQMRVGNKFEASLPSDIEELKGKLGINPSQAQTSAAPPPAPTKPPTPRVPSKSRP